MAKSRAEEFKDLLIEAGIAVKKESGQLDMNKPEEVYGMFKELLDINLFIVATFQSLSMVEQMEVFGCATCEKRDNCPAWLESQGVMVMEFPVRVQ
ncbi:MAG: hypothetical protein EHM41_00255 [Chloroflexi bacterium]|nr:MAG: hypothetical protein EHM41_00255 [Chloroflexota bacterium]